VATPAAPIAPIFGTDSRDYGQTLFSGAGTAGQLEGDLRLKALRAKEAELERAAEEESLGRDKARVADEQLWDPTNRRIAGEQKMAALESILPAGPSGRPESTIAAEHATDPEFADVLGGGSSTARRSHLETRPGLGYGTEPIPSRGDIARTKFAREVQLANMKTDMDKLEAARNYHQLIADTGQVHDPRTRATRPATTAEVADAKKKAEFYDTLHKRAIDNFNVYASGLAGHPTYPTPNMYSSDFFGKDNTTGTTSSATGTGTLPPIITPGTAPSPAPGPARQGESEAIPDPTSY